MTEDNISMKKMTEEMKASYEEKLEWNEIELEKCKISVAETEANTAMLMKDEHKKEIEREK